MSAQPNDPDEPEYTAESIKIGRERLLARLAELNAERQRIVLRLTELDTILATLDEADQ